MTADLLILAQQNFFSAIARTDLDAMAALWHDSPATSCCHPSAPLIYGYGHIVESWRRVFQGLWEPEITVSDVRSQRSDSGGFVTCRVDMYHANMTIVNIYIETPSGLKVIHYHGGVVEKRRESGLLAN